MRVGFLGSPTSWHLADLRRAAGDQHELLPVSFRRLTARLGGDAPGVRAPELDLTTCDGVVVRGMPPGSLEQVVFRMDALAELERRGVRIINPPRAIEAAVDKYLAAARMAAAGLPVVATWVGQESDAARNAFEQLGGDVVLKPIFGGEGRGVCRISDPAIAERTFRLLEQLGAAILLQPFVPHSEGDVRVLIVGERAVAMRRRHPFDWRTNVSQGGAGTPAPLDPHWEQLARRAADAVGATLAGVDLLPADDGQLYCLEVNAAPGWQTISRVAGVDVAAWVWELFEPNRKPLTDRDHDGYPAA